MKNNFIINLFSINFIAIQPAAMYRFALYLCYFIHTKRDVGLLFYGISGLPPRVLVLGFIAYQFILLIITRILLLLIIYLLVL